MVRIGCDTYVQSYPWNISPKMDRMAEEADRVYSTLLRHVVHNPRSQSQAAKLPIWIVAPDYPVKKQRGMNAKAILAEAKINDGLHLNGDHVDAHRYTASHPPEGAL